MKILMTGATGFIGSRVAEKLVTQGHELVVLARDPERARLSLGVPCAAYAWDAMGGAAPARAFDGVDAVIHLAGESVGEGRWTEARKKSIMESRTHGTRHLLDGLRGLERKPSAFVAASAVGFYGDRADEELIETSTGGDGFLSEVVRAWEAGTSRAADLGMRTVLLRFSTVLGEGGGALAKLIPMYRAGAGGTVGSGRQWMSWIHIDDVVSMLVQAVTDASWRGVLNATAPQPVTNAEFSRCLGVALGRPAILPAPAPALRIALGEMASLVLSSQRVLPRAALALGFVFKHEKLENALSAICDEFVRGGCETFVSRQWVPRRPEDVFEFFSEAKNLQALTPEWLDFKIVGQSTAAMGVGTLIDYRLKVHGLPMRWRSRIDQWVPNRSFVDTQLKGPYSIWHHTHSFVPAGGGTLVIDRVRYRVPAGLLGRAAAGRWVKRDVGEIFKYRRKRIQELFSGEMRR